MNDRDMVLLAKKTCPHCLSKLMPGPRGGAAQNFYCTNRVRCRDGYNLTFHDNRLIWAQAIGSVSDETYLMYERANHA
jgi:hypothetical protein